jgi:hypothetical protein
MRLVCRLYAIILAYTLSLTAVSAQHVVTVCGASTGYGYYLEPRNEGWQTDGISRGTITFVRDAQDKYDVVIKDAMTTFSANGDGAKVVRVDGSDDRAFTLLVAYPHPITELYQLTLDQYGRGTLIWASVKNRSPPLGITKGTLFTATCSK